MSLNSEQSIVQYTLTGSGQTLAVPFKFIAQGDLKVSSTIAGVDALLVLNTDYTVTGGGDATGSITLTAGANGTVITIDRQPLIEQPMSFAENAAFPSASTETNFDLVVMEIQRLWAALQRCMRVPNTNAVLAEMTLAQRTSQVPQFDSNGNLIFGAGGSGSTTKVSAPASSASSGAAGQWAIGSGYLYFYDAAIPAWCRVPISTW
jgi:hypothetical protein